MAKSILEYWKTCPNSPNFYVSTCGEVKSKDRWVRGNKKQGGKRFIRGIRKKISMGSHGYKVVNIDNRVVCIHRLVAEAFLPNPDFLPCVNHKDENKLNNWATNLEWCTYEYNVNYGTARERQAKNHSKPVYQYTLDGTFIKEWSSVKEIEQQTGWNQSCISKCCRGERKSAYGYIWKYK